MSVVDVLSQIEDIRKGNEGCDFNGYVEDYLSVIGEDDPRYELFQSIFNLDENARVCINYRFDINQNAISNQIIRYKDAGKLPKHYLVLPVILYSHGQSDFAYVLNQASGPNDYLYAKGRYYCLTEQYGLFEEFRNDVLTDILLDNDHIVETYTTLLDGNKRIGALQRELDRKVFNSFEECSELAMNLAGERRELILSSFAENSTNRAPMIYESIEYWFLLKKCLYVQYMSNKQILNEVNQGNLKLQRQSAKHVVDQVPFIPFSEMWRI